MKAHRLVALFAGRVPHAIGLVPGGVAQTPDKAAVASARTILAEIGEFVNFAYVPDVIALAKSLPGYADLGRFGDFLAYGEFPDGPETADLYFPRGIVSEGKRVAFDQTRITEQVLHSRYSSATNLHPSQGQTEPSVDKAGAYTWIKAPRYGGKPMEVGPLARMMVGYTAGSVDIRREVDALLAATGLTLAKLQSAIGRHAARAVESRLLCKKISGWLDEIEEGGRPRQECAVPESGEGAGLGEAPRGALGHWISVKNGKIARYQCIVPTTWNASPRDDNGVAGPMEQALAGTPVVDKNAHGGREGGEDIRPMPCMRHSLRKGGRGNSEVQGMLGACMLMRCRNCTRGKPGAVLAVFLPSVPPSSGFRSTFTKATPTMPGTTG